jgi:hypothetical protein
MLAELNLRCYHEVGSREFCPKYPYMGTDGPGAPDGARLILR